MFEIHTFKIFYLFLIILFNFLHHVISHQNDVDSYYKIHSLAEEEICHPLRNKLKPMTITRAIIIRPSNVLDHWLHRTGDLLCKFKIKTRSKERLMAVVQNLSFRQGDDNCIDYVKFKRKNHTESKRFCGYIDGVSIPKAYEQSDSDGELETIIFVSKESLEQNDPPLDITIVYTPFQDCASGYYERINDLNHSLRQRNYCISENYICDGYKNCIPEICKDELNCPSEVHNHGTGAKVTVAAVTTILLCFIIFLMGLWICRRHNKLCWSSDCAGPAPEDNRFPAANHEPTVASDQPVSSSPMLNVSVVSSAIDKDLPPSYDSLFPEHANPSAT